jgi:antitoxin component YwqK of YwqJK toxin-antitoxin module
MNSIIYTVKYSDREIFDEEVANIIEIGCEISGNLYSTCTNTTPPEVLYCQDVIIDKDKFWVRFASNGQIVYLENQWDFNNKKRKRKRIRWYPDGQIYEVTILNLDQGMLHTMLWHQNGRKCWDHDYVKGEKYQWHDNGEKQLVAIRKDGKWKRKAWRFDGSPLKLNADGSMTMEEYNKSLMTTKEYIKHLKDY